MVFTSFQRRRLGWLRESDQKLLKQPGMGHSDRIPAALGKNEECAAELHGSIARWNWASMNLA